MGNDEFKIEKKWNKKWICYFGFLQIENDNFDLLSEETISRSNLAVFVEEILHFKAFIVIL